MQTSTQTNVSQGVPATAHTFTIEQFSTQGEGVVSKPECTLPKAVLSRIEKIRISEYMLAPSAARRAVASTPRSTGICSTTELVTTLDQLCTDALFCHLLPFHLSAVGTDVKVTHNRPSSAGNILFIRGHVTQASDSAVDFSMAVTTLDGEAVASVTLHFALVESAAFQSPHDSRPGARSESLPDSAPRSTAVAAAARMARQVSGRSVWAFPPPPAPFSTMPVDPCTRVQTQGQDHA